MKILLILCLLSTMACSKESGGNYTGEIVRMTYDSYNKMDNTIDVLSGSKTYRIFECPWFQELKIGNNVRITCTEGYFSKCYVISKVKE